MIHYVHPSFSTPVGYWPVRSKEGMKEEEEQWVRTVSAITFISTLSDGCFFFYILAPKKEKRAKEEQGTGKNRSRRKTEGRLKKEYDKKGKEGGFIALHHRLSAGQYSGTSGRERREIKVNRASWRQDPEEYVYIMCRNRGKRKT